MKAAGIAVLALLFGACAPQRGEEITLRVDPGCDAAAKPCVAEAAGVSLSLELAAPKAMQPFAVQARWQGKAVESMVVDFTMVGMDMGQNRYRLVSDGTNPWRGTAVLPVCVMGRSDWMAEVQISGEDGTRYRAPIPFSVAR